MLNKIFLKSLFGINIVFLPYCYFFKFKNDKVSLLFLDKYFFFTVFKIFLNIYTNLLNFYFFRLKLRGLGLKIRKICNNLFKIFIAFNFFFYMHYSNNIFIKYKKKCLYVISNELSKLNILFFQLLILKKLDFYERDNTFIVPNKIIYIKKS